MKKNDEQGEGEEIRWESINVAFSFATCEKSAQSIQQQILKHAETQSFLTVITKDQIVEASKDHMLYIDPENITEKQKKEKGLEELPKVMTPQIMAKAAKLHIEDMNATFKEVRSDFELAKSTDILIDEKSWIIDYIRIRAKEG